MRRRAFGNTRRLPSGRWQARYRDGRGQEQTAMFATKAAAGRWLSSIETDIGRGDWADPRLARVTVGEWAEQWTATTVALKPKTRWGYASVLRTHVLPAFGDAPVSAVDTAAVRQLMANMLSAGSSPATATKARAVLRLVMSCALEGGAIKANPCVGVKVGRAKRREMVFLTPAQIEDLAEAITHPPLKPGGGGHRRAAYPELGLLVRLAAYTGLRAGELCALRVGRVDTMHRKLTVAESLADVGGTLSFGPTKNSRERVVGVPAFLIDPLLEHLATRPADPRALVFVGPEGGPMRHANVYRRHYRPAVARSGIPATTRFHDLRHTCAALLINGGAPQMAVMRRLGHSTITVTIDTYGHLFPEAEEALTDVLDGVGRAARPTETATVVPLLRTADGGLPEAVPRS